MGVPKLYVQFASNISIFGIFVGPTYNHNMSSTY
jgi:hypothetical protein